MVRGAMETDLIYKDETKKEFHIYTPEELKEKENIRLLRRKALSLYELADELFGKALTAYKAGDFGDARRFDVQGHECWLRGAKIEEEACLRQLRLLEAIGRVEGWEEAEDDTDNASAHHHTGSPAGQSDYPE